MFRSALLASAAFAAALPAFAQTAPALPPIELDEISVTANLTPTPTAHVGSAVTIITREELERKQVRFVSDALRSVPGVSVNRTGGFGGLTQTRIRGAASNHTLVMIDGVEVNDPAGTGSFNFAHLLVQNIERIEVLRGPQSSLYGSDAIGGVVNIVTQRGEGPARLSGFIEGGNRGTVSGGATLSGSTDRVDYLIGAGGTRTDGFSAAAEWRPSSTGGLNTEKDGYENIGAVAKIGIQATDNLRFDFTGRGYDYYAEGDDEGGFGWPPPPFPGGAYDFLFDLEGRQVFGRAQATLDLFDGKWQQVAGVSKLTHDWASLYDTSPPATYEGERSRLDYRSHLFLNSGEIAHTLTFAADHEVDSMAHDSMFDSFEEEVSQTGVSGEYKMAAWDRLFLSGSVRHDFNDGFDDATTWRLTGAYLFQESGTKVRASYGTGVKNPTLTELYVHFNGFTPNPDLKPESARGWDIGVDQSLIDGRVDASLTYFEQRIEDLIVTRSGTVENEPGTSSINGVEFSLAARPMDELVVRASFTWQDATGANDVWLARTPEFLGSLDADYVFADGRTSAGVSVVYNGRQRDEPFWRAPLTLDDYTLVHMRAAYKFNEFAEVYARVENLFDEEYEEVHTFGGTGRLGIVGVRGTF